MSYKWKDRKAEYQKQYHAEWYQRNKERERARIEAGRAEKRAWLEALKATLKCNRCPENDASTLDFHHRNPKEKEFSLYEAVSRNYGKARILAEIAKCEVLCSNCHRKQHKDEKGKKLT